MRVQEHLTLSLAATVVAFPWLKKAFWVPLLASVLIDVDHYLWHAVTYRTLSLRAAVRYFGQADPPQLLQARLLHHPLFLGGLLFLALRLRSRALWLILSGLTFHVGLDGIHVQQMQTLKRTLSERANSCCPICGMNVSELQLHTFEVAPLFFGRYHPRHYQVMCPTCHEQAHAKG